MTEACYGRPAGRPETELQEDTVQLNRENLITVIETGKVEPGRRAECCHQQCLMEDATTSCKKRKSFYVIKLSCV